MTDTPQSAVQGDRLSEIQARRAAITPGRWEVRSGYGDEGGIYTSFEPLVGECGWHASDADEAFVTNAAEDLDWLVSSLLESRASVEALEKKNATGIVVCGHKSGASAWPCSKEPGHSDGHENAFTFWPRLAADGCQAAMSAPIDRET